MAICLKCHHPMSQIEAACPHCGEDYRDFQPSYKQVLFHRSSLRDLFYLITVMGILSALLRWVLSLHLFWLWPVAAGFLAGICALLLGERAPFWSRVLSLIGILSFLTYPIVISWLFCSRFAIGVYRALF